jgi:transcriptional regulator with GAF, ATPase, and Fis domain
MVTTSEQRRAFDPERALRHILDGTAAQTGARFFATLVRSLAETLDTHGAWVTEYQREARRLRALAFWLGGRWVSDFEYDITDTPCAPVVEDVRLIHVADRVLELYPRDRDLAAMQAVSYLGVPLLDLDGKVLGHLAVLDTRPLAEDARCLAVFQIFAARAAAELRQLRAESQVRARDVRLESLEVETEYLRQELRTLGGAGTLLGESAAMRRVRREIDEVAATDATALVLGETGTGKELVARAIHDKSRRRGKPLVRVNCAAVPSGLIESEFFGHERGAFTGATQRRCRTSSSAPSSPRTTDA